PAINGTNLTIPVDPKSWFDFKILGRTSNKDVKNVFWNVLGGIVNIPIAIIKKLNYL
ncbi:MAG: hypothetical protein KR126chlam5_01010, partial [Candidatus Anoxychlamydiales bacterium]|nr:hypothetical protein [Candidatus Anoxychlamydiales bacterium]